MVCPSYEVLFHNKKEWITDILQCKWGFRALWRQSQKTTCCMSEKSPSSVISEPKKRKNWCWSWSSNTLAMWCQQLTHWKDPDVGKDWGQKEKRATEDENVGWHHRFNRHELRQTPGDHEGQTRLVCCSPWGHRELDVTLRISREQQCEKCRIGKSI